MNKTRRQFFRFLGGACAAVAVVLRLPKIPLAIEQEVPLEDLIYNILPMDTPLLVNTVPAIASRILHRWQTGALAAAAQNTVTK